ncbi:hypothetical protein Sango_0525600 [Sesamum angolense]|uniref:Uncharacterized protein n=1 Tax=Sesamum angolense TaxID=2727404 RepID=A0AAE1X4X7_9LAMI|nr:hypothetical protein Sango_0525600 [Sesamum angolense]
MNVSLEFIWRTFQQNTPSDRKTLQKVSLFVDDMDWAAYTANDQIHVSASGNGQAPGGLIEGIADFVRLKAGYAPIHWVRPGQGRLCGMHLC